PSRSSMFFTYRSKSAFVTGSPFTRASTSGSCAGTGLGADGAHGGAGAREPGAPPQGAAPEAPAPEAAGFAAAVCAGPPAAAGARRQATPAASEAARKAEKTTLVTVILKHGPQDAATDRHFTASFLPGLSMC